MTDRCEKNQRSLPQNIFRGSRKDEDLSRYYASADLFLFSSLSETYGLVVAMASGLPVIGFNNAAPAALIEPWVNGWLAPFGDKKAFSRIAVKAAHIPMDKLQAMRESACLTARSLTWSDCLDDLENILINSLKGNLNALTNKAA